MASDRWSQHDTEASEAQRAEELAFRRRHGQVGIALSLAAIVELLAYTWLSDGASNRVVLTLLSVVAAAGTFAIAAILARLVRSRGHRMFFFVWSVTIIGLTLAATGVDGGETSPVAFTLFLPLMFSALGYEPPAVVALAGLTVGGYIAVALQDATPSGAHTVLFSTTLALAGLMAALAARNRGRQRQKVAELTRRLETAALHDDLTGCINRRGFAIVLEREIARAERYQRPLALLLVDVDNLKAINDEAGHVAGDEALVAVADALRSAARRSDVVARLGGDEFAVLAPEADVEDATEIAARVHSALRTSGSPVRPTASVGVAARTADTSDEDRLLRTADRALYEAKRSGRNRTAVSADLRKRA